MPKGVVKTPTDEKRWEEAKKRVRDEYDLTEDDDRFWRLVNGIYQRMSKSVTDEELDSYDIMEGLSSLVHDQWIDFAKEVEGEVAPKRAEAWQSMYVPYFELPEVEKEKDRVFARRIVFLLQNPRVANDSIAKSEGKHRVRTYKRSVKGKQQTVNEHEASNPKRSRISLDSSLRRVENKIRYYTKGEAGYVFDKAGRTLWKDYAEGDSLELYEAQKNGLLKGNVFTHNHPNRLSFSPEDILAMLKTEMKEIRAVTDRFTYIARAPESFSLSFEKVNEIFDVMNKEAENLEQELSNIGVKGTMSIEEINTRYYHEIWKRTAEKTGLYYRRDIFNGINKAQKIHTEHGYGQRRSDNRQGFSHAGFRQNYRRKESRSTERAPDFTRIGFPLSKGFSDARVKPFAQARHTGQRASAQLREWGGDTHAAGPEDVYTLYRRLMGAEGRGEITVSTLKTDERGSILRVTDGKVTFRVYEPRNGPVCLLKGLHTYTPAANAVWTILRNAGYEGKPIDGVGRFAGCTITVKGADVHVEGKKAHRILQLLEREMKHKITTEAWVGGHQQLGQPSMTVHPW